MYFHRPLDLSKGQIFVSSMILTLECFKEQVPFQSGCYKVCHLHLVEQYGNFNGSLQVKF